MAFYGGLMAFYGGLVAFYGGLMAFYGGFIGSNGNFNGIWLVVDLKPLWKIMEWSSVGVMKFPTEWKVIKFMVQTTNQTLIIGYKRINDTNINSDECY